MERQIATNRLQSDRLLKCGVQAESADMYINNYDELWAAPFKDCARKKEEGFAPAFSLSSLLSLLPKEIKIDGYAYRISIYFESPEEPVIGNQWCLYYKPVKYTEKSRIDDVAMYAENLLECTVLMAEYLYEHGYKLNESKE